MRIAVPKRRRLALFVTGLLAAVVLASSCSIDAAVATDGSGRVIGINALRVRSSALDLAFALALEGRQFVLELRWRSDPAKTAPFF